MTSRQLIRIAPFAEQLPQRRVAPDKASLGTGRPALAQYSARSSASSRRASPSSQRRRRSGRF